VKQLSPNLPDCNLHNFKQQQKKERFKFASEAVYILLQFAYYLSIYFAYLFC